MNTIPVNTNGMTFTYLATVPKLDLQGNTQRNADGIPKHEMQLLVSTELARRPEVLPVTIATPNPPELAPMTEVQVEGLVARAWSQGDRSGVAFSADLIRPSGRQSKPPAPSTNGTKPAEAAAAS